MENASPARLKKMAGYLIYQNGLHAHRLLVEGLTAVESTGYNYRLLAALEEFGPASQAVLGRRTGIDRSDVVAALNDLAERGYIERTPDPDDRRRNTVVMTPAGQEHFAQLDKAVLGVQDDFLAPLSPKEREQLIELLNRTLDHHTLRGQER